MLHLTMTFKTRASATIRYSRSTESVTIGETLTEFYRATTLMETFKRFLKNKKENGKNKKKKVNDMVDNKIEEAENILTVGKTDENFNKVEEILPTHDTKELTRSCLISKEDFAEIGNKFSLKTFSKKLSLVYSSFEHGYSLQTLYRKSRTWELTHEVSGEQKPSMLLISDTKGHVLGIATSCLPRVRGCRYMGTGESFLFTLHPNIEVYPWTGKNELFLHCGKDFLTAGGSVGAKKLEMGLWLDNDIKFGKSTKCETYDNRILASDENFEIYGVELWTFES